MDVERNLISKVLLDRDIVPVLDAKVRPDFFEDDENASVFGWMVDYYQRYSSTPTAKALRQNYPNFEVLKAGEPLQFYIDELLRAHRYSLLVETAATLGAALKSGDIDQAEQIVRQSNIDLSADLAPLADVNLTDPEVIEEWIERYRELQSLDGRLRGLPTGFRTMDLATGGLQPQQLVTLIGLPKAGKSTLLMLMAMSVHKAGARPLFVGFEMSNEEQQDRMAAIRAGVDFNKLYTGRLSPPEVKRVEKAVRELEATPDFTLVADISGSSTISGIVSKLEAHKPSALFIDGVYLMQDEITGEQNTPQALTNITRGLKRLAQRSRIPIVQTTQSLVWKVGRKTGITADTIGYTSSFAQDSDVIFGQESTDDDDIKKLKIVAARNARNRSVLLSWSWERSEFEEMEDDADYDSDTGPDPL